MRTGVTIKPFCGLKRHANRRNGSSGFSGFGPPSVLRIEEVAIPQPGEFEALVQVKACSDQSQGLRSGFMKFGGIYIEAKCQTFPACTIWPRLPAILKRTFHFLHRRAWFAAGEDDRQL
jgi:hypothetical protein